MFGGTPIPLLWPLVGMGAESLDQQQLSNPSAACPANFWIRCRGLTHFATVSTNWASLPEFCNRALGPIPVLSLMETLRVAFLSVEPCGVLFSSCGQCAVIACISALVCLGSTFFGPAADLTLFSGFYLVCLPGTGVLSTLAHACHSKLSRSCIRLGCGA